MITKNINDKLENMVIRMYEGLYKQIKESEESPEKSIEDIEMKIDVIMDALGLGLENEDKEEESKKEKIDVTEVENENVEIPNPFSDEIDETTTTDVEFVENPTEEESDV